MDFSTQKIGTKKTVVTALLALGIFGVGALLWLGWRFSQVPQGKVLSETTASESQDWGSGMLVLTSNPQEQLAVLSDNGSINKINLQNPATPVAGMLSEDGRTLLMVFQDGDVRSFWHYAPNKEPQFLFVFSGAVSHLSLVAGGDQFSFLGQRVGESQSSLFLFEREQGTLRRVANDVKSALWLDREQAFVTSNNQNEIVYYSRAIGGDINEGSVLTSSLSTPAVTTSGDVLFLAERGGVLSLVQFNLASKKDEVLLQLPNVRLQGLAQLVSAPGSQVLALHLPPGAGEQNSQVMLLHLQEATMSVLPVPARMIRWFDHETLVLERAQGTSSQFWRMNINSTEPEQILQETLTVLLP